MDQSDITAQKTHESIKQLLNGRSVDVVISDMAPNPTGNETFIINVETNVQMLHLIQFLQKKITASPKFMLRANLKMQQLDGGEIV